MKNVVIDLNIKDKKWETKKIFLNYEKVVEEIVLEVFSVLEVGFIEENKIEIAVFLINNKEIQELNKRFRKQDKPTNVLSFPIFEEKFKKEMLHLPYLTLGDIFLSLDVLLEEAKKQKKTAQDHFKHLLVHGLLHLLGYDHCNDKDAEEMEELEKIILNQLTISN